MIALAAALAAPVVCDGATARRILDDARVLPERVPVTQPNLLPGLARGAAAGEVAEALEALCAGPGDLSLAPMERWESATAAAYSFVLTQSETTACAVEQDAVVLTVGVEPGRPPRYALRSRLPRSVTPIGACEDVRARYQSERTVDGAEGPVRLVLITDHEGETRTGARLVVRNATPAGWREQVLLDPAPDRMLDPDAGGPLVELSGSGDDTWIVAHGDRAVQGGSCAPVPGQTVWRWQDGAWTADQGRRALGLLARRGAWRLAGEAAWFLILTQDTPADRELLEARARRLQRRNIDPLALMESASFPEMNAGFVIVAPDPWPSEAEAEAARRAWGRRTGVYVRQGWAEPDPCTPR